MMPHPERAAEPELGMTDGAKVFHSLVGHGGEVAFGSELSAIG